MVGIDRFNYWIYDRGNDMSRMSDLDIDRQDKEASNGDYSQEDCREPDQKDYTKQVMASEEYKAEMGKLDRKVVYGVPEITQKEYDAFKNNPNNFDHDEESTDDMTPSQENEWLRSCGY